MGEWETQTSKKKKKGGKSKPNPTANPNPPRPNPWSTTSLSSALPSQSPWGTPSTPARTQAAPRETQREEQVVVDAGKLSTPEKTTSSSENSPARSNADEAATWQERREEKKINPQVGTVGQKVQLYTNRINLLQVPKKLKVYRFLFTDAEGKESRDKIDITKFIDIGNQPLAYDGSKILVQYGVYTQLDKNQRPIAGADVAKDVHQDESVMTLLQKMFEQHRGRVSLQGGPEMITLDDSGQSLSMIHTQLLDIILSKNLPSALFQPLASSGGGGGRGGSRGGRGGGRGGRGGGHGGFDREAAEASTLDIRYRYRTAIIGSEVGTQMALDVQGSIVYKKMKLLEHLEKTGLLVNGKFTKDPKYIAKDLEGLKLKANHRPAENVVSFKGFSDNNCGAEKTDPIDGKTSSVADYFLARYNLRVNPNLPCVRTSLTKRIFYPLETLDVVAEQQFRREIPRSAVKDVHLPPDKRQKKILAGLKETQKALDRSSNSNISISKDLVQVTGREIGSTMAPKNGRFCDPKQIKKWAVLNTDDRANPKDIDVAVKAFINAAKGYGMNVGSPFLNVAVNRRQSLKSILDPLVVQGLDFVLLVKSEQDKDRYNEAKVFSWVSSGIPVQVCLSKHFRNADERRLAPYMGNLLLKVNVKMGGSNFRFRERVAGLPDKCLILGMDVCHGQLNINTEGTATAALIACDPSTNLMYSAFTAQKGRSDILEEETFHYLLRSLKVDFSKYSSIIMYRDGVGESMFLAVEQKEYNALRNFNEIPANTKISYLVFNKRHRTRFFKVGDRGIENPNAGTVVDTVVTNKGDFDFYLQAHSCGIGSASLPHYIFIHDDHAFTGDAIQNVTNKLSALYQRSFGPVSQTCAAYYAHILAEKCRFLMKDDGKFPALNNKLLTTSRMYFL